MTLDGICDHTAIVPDEEIHQHYTDLINNAGAILYGRITYQLMQFWQTLLKNPSGEKSMDDFAVAIDKVPKIVFSHTLKSTGWDNAKLSDQSLEKSSFKTQTRAKPREQRHFSWKPEFILQLLKLNLIDEFQLCVHPVIAGSGLPLFENVNDRTIFKLLKTKTFTGGAVTHYYEPIKITGGEIR